MERENLAAQEPLARRIGILGGTFNPPHLGHLRIAEQAHREFELDKVIVLPVGIPPHKREEAVLSADQREQLCRLFCQEGDFLELCTMELRREGYTYTIDTLRAFHKILKPGQRIYYIIGTDTLFQLETWKEYEAVLSQDLCTFLCVPRPGDPMHKVKAKIRQLKEEYGVKILLSAGAGPDISSTMVREALGRGERVDALVPARVLQFMEAEHVFEGA